MAPGRGTRLTVAGTAVALLLAACGGDKPKLASPTTTVAPATTTTTSQTQADHDKAQRVVLTAADLPGYTQDPPDPSTKSTDLEAAANACVNNNALLARLGEGSDPRGASSADFSKGDAIGISNDVTFGENEDAARSALAALGSPSFPGCFSNALAAELRKDPTFANVSVSTSKLPNVAAGDQSIGYRSVARAQVRGTALTINFDFTFVRAGRGVAVLSEFAVNAAFPEAERARLVTAVAGRLAAP